MQNNQNIYFKQDLHKILKKLLTMKVKNQIDFQYQVAGVIFGNPSSIKVHFSTQVGVQRN